MAEENIKLYLTKLEVNYQEADGYGKVVFMFLCFLWKLKAFYQYICFSKTVSVELWSAPLKEMEGELEALPGAIKCFRRWIHRGGREDEAGLKDSSSLPRTLPESKDERSSQSGRVCM